jgi:hypothetical protein
MAGKTIAEQIADLEATREAKSARMQEVMQKSIDEDRSTDTAEAEEFDTLESQIKNIDGDLVRLRKMERVAAAAAKPAADDAAQKANSAANDGTRIGLSLKTNEKLEPGQLAARYIMCLGVAKGNHAVAFQLAEKHYPSSESVVRTLKAQAEGADIGQMLFQKATVPAGTTTDSTWAAPLAYVETWAGDFVTYNRPRTLIGQARFRPVPFNVRIGGQTSGGSANWVGQGKSKPVTKFDFTAYTTAYTKIAAISVVTKELLRLSDPSAELLVRDGLSDAVVAKLDTDLFDPDVAAVSGINPAGLLNGVNPVAGPASLDPDDIRCALARLWAPWDSLFMGERPAYYTTPAVARMLSMARDALGNTAFPGVTPFGGTLDGVPLRVSQYLANNGGSGGAPLILVDEAEIWLADDGSVTLDFSDHATIEMSDTPVGSSSATVTSNGSPFVNMFQTNSRAFLAERAVWYATRRAGAVQWIDGFPTSC